MSSVLCIVCITILLVVAGAVEELYFAIGKNIAKL